MNLKDLFQGMLPKAQEEIVVPEEELVPEEKKIKLPEFNSGAPVDLVSKDGVVLLSGRPTFFDASRLTLERIPGEMGFPVLEEGLEVGVRGFSEEMIPLNYSGRVTRSTSVMCSMGSLLYLPYQNIRSSQRQPLHVTAAFYEVGDTLFDRPEPCTVLNISTGGACVSTTCRYPEGKELRLRLEVVKGGGYSSFVGQIVRIVERENGVYEYGMLFAQLRRSQINGLMNDIAEFQKETQKLMKD